MSEFINIHFKDTDIEIKKLKLKKDDIIVIRSETITPRMIEAFRGYCQENNIKNNTIFLHKTMDIDKTTLENLIKKLQEKKKKENNILETSNNKTNMPTGNGLND